MKQAPTLREVARDWQLWLEYLPGRMNTLTRQQFNELGYDAKIDILLSEGYENDEVKDE